MASKTITVTDIRITRASIQPPNPESKGEDSETKMISVVDYELIDADGNAVQKKSSWLWVDELSTESKKLCDDYHAAIKANMLRIEKMS